MVVQHNLLAMNSNRMLGVITGRLAKVTEKLSSGYKINRSADDAAGLAISEKMRRQIRGLTQASINAQDGISLMQVADGALTEVHDMLQRMNELSVKAANGTNTAEDRSYIQAEVDALIAEIDRIGNTTQFNERLVFCGGDSSSGSGSSGGAVSSQDAINAIQNAVSTLNGTISGTGTGTISVVMDSNISDGQAITIAGKSYTIGASTPYDVYTTPAVQGTHYTVNSVNVPGSASAASMATGSYNPLDVTVSASFSKTPTSEAEKNAQNDFLDKIKKGAFSSSKNSSGRWRISGGYTNSFYSYDFYKKDSDLGSYDFPASAKIKQNGTVVGTIRFELANGGTGATIGTSAISGGTITQATYTAAQQKDVLTANTDLYNSSGARIVSSGSKIDVGSMDLSSLRLKTTMPAMADVNGDGIDDSNPATISGAKAYELIESSLPTGFTKSTSGGQITYTFAETASSGGSGGTSGSSGSQSGLGNDDFVLSLQVGAEAGQHIDVGLERMNSKVIGVNGLDVTTENSAGSAIDTVKGAIEKISGMRSKYGACQNRLEHTIRNLDNVVENTTSSESAIRDTDMAKSMVEFSKLQILQQVGQSVLAQANQNNSTVLSLLQ